MDYPFKEKLGLRTTWLLGKNVHRTFSNARPCTKSPFPAALSWMYLCAC